MKGRECWGPGAQAAGEGRSHLLCGGLRPDSVQLLLLGDLVQTSDNLVKRVLLPPFCRQ